MFVGVLLLAVVEIGFHSTCAFLPEKLLGFCKLSAAGGVIYCGTEGCRRKELCAIQKEKKGIVPQNTRIIFLTVGILSVLQYVPRKNSEEVIPFGIHSKTG